LNAAAARLRAPGYVVVEDRVREVRVEKSNTLLLLGDRRGDIEIAVPHRDRPRLAAAGIDLQRLAGTCVRSEGKLGNKGQRPRLWVSHPAWLEVTACAPTRADPADGNTVRSNKPHPARSKKARTGKVKPH
jgi:hypothetical protein